MIDPGPSGVESLRASPAGFDQDDFLQEVHDRVTAIKAAQAAREPDRVAALLTPAFRRALLAQADEQARQHAFRRLDGLTLESMRIARAGHDGEFDHVTVRIDGQVADYAVTETGEILFGERAGRPFTEYWTFTRIAAGAASRTGCPTCGAPMEGDSATCRYCRGELPPQRGVWLAASAGDILEA